jgi:hypothetical protein
LAVLILVVLAALFWHNPENGLKQTTHRRENLPLVMANRYTAFAVLGTAIVLSGHLPLLAVFFAVCAFMGFADGWNYARSGLAHIKHTASGVLSVVCLGVTLAALAG